MITPSLRTLPALGWIALLATTATAGDVDWAAPLVLPTTPHPPLTEHIGDVDGDGDPDLYAGDSAASALFWYENAAGDGTVWTHHAVPWPGPDARPGGVADLDGDGDGDLIYTTVDFDSVVGWLENIDGAGTSWSAHTIATIGWSDDLWAHPIDVDGDGRVDVAYRWDEVGDFGAEIFGYYRNDDGLGTSWTEVWIDFSDWLVDGRWADLDGDGDLDLAGNHTWGLGGTWWWERTATSWVKHAVVGSGTFAGRYAAPADVDGNGANDVVVFDAPDDLAWIRNRNGDGTLWILNDIPTTHADLSPPRPVDVDGDGDVDLLSTVTTAGAEQLVWFENGGDGTSWTERVVADTDPFAYEALPLDVDTDGDQDVFAFSVAADQAILVRASTWSDVGSALAGGAGTPDLDGTGPLCDGAPTTLTLSDAAPASTAYFVLGLSQVSAPFKGGVLVPSPDVVVGGLPTLAGELVVAFPWFSGVPTGVTFVFQYWIVDGSAPFGFSASNGLVATTP